MLDPTSTPLPGQFREGTLAWVVAHEAIRHGHTVGAVVADRCSRREPYACAHRLRVNGGTYMLHEKSMSPTQRHTVLNKQHTKGYILQLSSCDEFLILPLAEVSKRRGEQWYKMCVYPVARWCRPLVNAWHLLA